MIKSITIRAAVIGAVIGGLFIIAAAILPIIFYRANKQQSLHIKTDGNVQAPITALQETGDVTINYNISTTVTKEAIQELENKLDQTDTKIELTRKEIKLLANALRDLDQRTSGIEKLPDGRTKFGHFVSGEPSIVIQEHKTAVSYFQNNDFEKAFEHSQNAIKALEETKKSNFSMSTGDLTPEMIEKIYRLSSITAQLLQKNELAYQYAEKSVEAKATSFNKAHLSTTMANLNRVDEALQYINEALQTDTQNGEFNRLKKIYEESVRRQNITTP